jgi:ABC-type multidrug transport system ATPase subunit
MHWVVEDLSSSNGTFHRGVLVSEVVIKNKQALQLGGNPGLMISFSLVGDGSKTNNSSDKTRFSNTSDLEFTSSDSKSVIRLTQRIRIGRDESNDWVLPDLTVSRFHAEILANEDGTYSLFDLSSANGTFLNGSRIKKSPLTFGNTIEVGGYVRTLTPQGLQIETGASGAEIIVNDVSLTIGKKKLLNSVNLNIGGSSFTAIIGPSGAGKSTILSILSGRVVPSTGNVSIDGDDLNEKYDLLKSRIGLVPQADIIHTKLTARQAINYGAQLRLPSDVSKSERIARVSEIISILELQGKEDLRIEKLSGGQRKRVSIALELITKPDVLFLDEPTSGLDPGLDAHVMKTLRSIADNGQTVVVVTHAVENLNYCDNVVLMASGGKVAYSGPPSGVFSAFGCASWSDVFRHLADQDAIDFDVRTLKGEVGHSSKRARQVSSHPQNAFKQVITLMKRYLTVIGSDRFFLGLLILVPVIMGVLSYATGSKYGFGEGFTTKAGFTFNPTARSSVMVLVLGTIFIALSSSILEVIKEKTILSREINAGVRPLAYVLSKAFVLSFIVSIQIILFTSIVLFNRPMAQIATFTNSPFFSILIICCLLGVVTLLLGLFISSIISSTDQAMPTLVGIIMIQIILSGLLPIDFKGIIEQISPFIPSYLATNALAGVTDLAHTTFVQDEKLLLRWSTDSKNVLNILAQMLFFIAFFLTFTTRLIRNKS